MRFYTRQQMARVALLLVGAGACGVAVAQSYHIQAGAYATAKEAQVAADRLMAECAPVLVHEVADQTLFAHKVHVGVFHTYAEAWAYKSLLNSPNLAGTFIVAGSGTEAGEANRLPVRLPFNTRGLDEPEPDDGPAFWEAAGLDGANAAKGGLETAAELEMILAASPAGREADRICLRLARKYSRAGQTTRTAELLAAVRRSEHRPERVMADFIAAHADLHRGARGEALGKFLALSNDETVPPSLRRESMRRSAALFHSLQRYPEAWMAYDQIAGTASRPSERQEARKDLAGLAFELAGRGKGSWSEVRRFCRAVANHHETPRRARATAELMAIETLWEEDRAGEALTQIELFRMSYSDVQREAHVAGVWRGIFLWRLGRLSEAQSAFEEAAEMSRGATEKFAGVEPREKSAAWLHYLASRNGDSARKKHWKDVLEKEFAGRKLHRRPTSEINK